MEFGTIRTLEEFRAAGGVCHGREQRRGIFSLSPFLDPSLHAHSGSRNRSPDLADPGARRPDTDVRQDLFRQIGLAIAELVSHVSGGSPPGENPWWLARRLDRDLYRVVAQAGLFLTICGETRKVSRTGEPYGWPVSLFCTPEAFFPGDVWEESLRIAPEEACFRIREQIARLNPQADKQAVRRFIGV